MKLHELTSAGNKSKTRVGRGNGSKGTFCGRGCKGQGQRKSGNVRPGFEGGQTPLYRRLPKLRGFKNPNKVAYQVVNVSTLDSFKDGETINTEILFEKGMIEKKNQPVKILGNGNLSKKLTIAPDLYLSASAKEKITKASGTIQAES